MTERFINGIGWICIPEQRPAELVNKRCEWDDCHETIMRALLPIYGPERTAWALGRTLYSVQTHASLQHFSYARTNPHVDSLGKVA